MHLSPSTPEAAAREAHAPAAAGRPEDFPGNAPSGWAQSRALRYASTDAQDAPRLYSGRLYLPTPRLRRSGTAVPLVVYVHATIRDRNHLPLFGRGPEALLAAMGARFHGFAVAMPDLPGLGADPSPRPHPYCHAKSLAPAVLDMIPASLRCLAGEGLAWDGRIFLLGYSSGAYGALAALKEQQSQPRYAALPITAAACMAGPFSLTDTFHALFAQPQPYAHLDVPPLLFASYHDQYPEEAALTPERMLHPRLLVPHAAGPDQGDVRTWLTQDASPRLTSRKIALRLTGNPDAPLALSAIMNPEWLRDQVLTPAWPDTTVGRILQDNDLVGGWQPRVPVLLATSAQDRCVAPANTQALLAAWTEQGGAPVTVAPLTLAGLTLGHKRAATLALAKACRWFKTMPAPTQKRHPEVALMAVDGAGG